MAGSLRITLRRSAIGRPSNQKDTLRTLGLRRINSSIERPDTPTFRGMIKTVEHLVIVEEVQDGPAKGTGA